MPFTVPSMPLTCRVFHGKAGGPFPLTNPDLTPPCQLRFPGLRSAVSGTATKITDMLIIVPKGTDIRGPSFGIQADAIECPAGSGRYYVVQMVDDVAKGFSNEYRFALVTWQNNSANGWPVPLP